jgi:hypothetical protein
MVFKGPRVAVTVGILAVVEEGVITGDVVRAGKVVVRVGIV